MDDKKIVTNEKGNEKKVDGFALTLKEIKTLIKGTKITERENKTGSSFFDGSKRFCKVVKTGKEAVYLELNVKLPEKYKKLDGMETFSPQEASKKHLGTLVHIFRGKDEKVIKEVINEAFNVFQAELTKKVEQANKDAANNKESSKGSTSNVKEDKKEKVTNPKMETRQISDEDKKKLQQWEREGKLGNGPNVLKEDKKPVAEKQETTTVQATKEEVKAK